MIKNILKENKIKELENFFYNLKKNKGLKDSNFLRFVLFGTIGVVTILTLLFQLYINDLSLSKFNKVIVPFLMLSFAMIPFFYDSVFKIINRKKIKLFKHYGIFDLLRSYKIYKNKNLSDILTTYLNLSEETQLLIKENQIEISVNKKLDKEFIIDILIMAEYKKNKLISFEYANSFLKELNKKENKLTIFNIIEIYLKESEFEEFKKHKNKIIDVIKDKIINEKAKKHFTKIIKNKIKENAVAEDSNLDSLKDTSTKIIKSNKNLIIKNI